MEGVTTKILDNTVIVACLGDIKSVNLLELCASQYNLVTSKEVHVETMRYPDQEVVGKLYERITVKDKTPNSQYQTLLAYLETRYPYLHRGELSSFLLALLEYEFTAKKYYYLTDDRRMRNTIAKIIEDPIFSQILGKKIVNVTYSGTLGLIRRVYDRGLLTPTQLEQIIEDLQKGDFYMTPHLIDYLRGVL